MILTPRPLLSPAPLQGTQGLYVEFPVDLVTDIHWKKPDTGDGTPPVYIQCGSEFHSGRTTVNAPPTGVERSSAPIAPPGTPTGWSVFCLDMSFVYNGQSGLGPVPSMTSNNIVAHVSASQVRQPVMGGFDVIFGNYTDGDPPISAAGSGCFSTPVIEGVTIQVTATSDYNYFGLWFLAYTYGPGGIAWTANETDYCAVHVAQQQEP